VRRERKNDYAVFKARVFVENRRFDDFTVFEFAGFAIGTTGQISDDRHLDLRSTRLDGVEMASGKN
jgi:hypothetical protein